MSNQEKTPPNHGYRATLTEGQRIPQTHPNAIVEWQPGKPPGGVPVKKPTDRQTK